MKKKFTLALPAILLFGLIFISQSIGLPQDTQSLVDKIRIMPEDIPQGFMYGIIPDVYKKTLKNNPWAFDN